MANIVQKRDKDELLVMHTKLTTLSLDGDKGNVRNIEKAKTSDEQKKLVDQCILKLAIMEDMYEKGLLALREPLSSNVAVLLKPQDTHGWRQADISREKKSEGYSFDPSTKESLNDTVSELERKKKIMAEVAEEQANYTEAKDAIDSVLNKEKKGNK